MKPKRGRKVIGVFKMVVNGETIEAQKYEGGWFWKCPSLPFIAREFDGSDTVQPAVEAFMRRVLKPAAHLRSAMIEIG